MSSNDTLARLMAVLEQRKQAEADSSYVAKLYAGGMDKILKKVGEEASETIMAAKDVEYGGEKSKLVYETADLWFHSLVMLAHADLSAADVLSELERRFGLSGLEEKASRSKGS